MLTVIIVYVAAVVYSHCCCSLSSLISFQSIDNVFSCLYFQLCRCRWPEWKLIIIILKIRVILKQSWSVSAAAVQLPVFPSSGSIMKRKSVRWKLLPIKAGLVPVTSFPVRWKDMRITALLQCVSLLHAHTHWHLNTIIISNVTALESYKYLCRNSRTTSEKAKLEKLNKKSHRKTSNLQMYFETRILKFCIMLNFCEPAILEV